MNEETRNAIMTALSEISWCIGYCFDPDNQLVRDKLRNAQRLLTELVAAEKHPLYAGEIDGRELRRTIMWADTSGPVQCPFCERDYNDSVAPKPCKCGATIIHHSPFLVRDWIWLAPAPPAPVKEPEPDEFEKWLQAGIDSGDTLFAAAMIKCRTKYREIKQGAH